VLRLAFVRKLAQKILHSVLKFVREIRHVNFLASLYSKHAFEAVEVLLLAKITAVNTVGPFLRTYKKIIKNTTICKMRENEAFLRCFSLQG
jgi:hypothetical protein